MKKVVAETRGRVRVACLSARLDAMASDGRGDDPGASEGASRVSAPPVAPSN